ncbi:hypothetical protein GJAV_G00019180 [Gymnothorax javanicus]|nr:hypothetical protein GJAV_G00019180 [Gymnothorax javanicus]
MAATVVSSRVITGESAGSAAEEEEQSAGDSSAGEESRDGGSELEGESDGGSERNEEAGDGEMEEEQEEGGNTNAGWAEAMAKILKKKTPENQAGILIKNKELEREKEKVKKEQQERKKQLDKKRAWEMMCREKPDVVKDRDTERNLQRIATRGMVQLFNAVRKHQRNVEERVKEVGGSERKRAKLLSSVSKKDFIDVLRGTDGAGQQGSRINKKVVSQTAEETPAWSVLKDDFMMGASMKDWDKESEEEGGEAQGGPRDYSSDSD